MIISHGFPSLQSRLQCEPSVADTKQTIETVKDFISKDSGKRLFKPALLKRKCVSEHIYEILSTGEGDEGVQVDFLRRLRKSFRDKVLDHDFLTTSKTSL